MGNEGSNLSGLVIEEKAAEITDFWGHYQATINDSCRYFSLKSDGSVSVFKGESVLGPLWSSASPLEKFCNNLLKYRHPCIVRYLSAWRQRSTLHMATEYIQPISHILRSLTPLQICVGLNNILRALVFLHEQAGMSHNNVSLSALYVTGDGQWKLGGLQYLCGFNELTTSYLKQARIHRYDKAVDPNEDSYQNTNKVDQYSFAVLVEDVFAGRNDDEVPYLNEFKKYCRDCLQHNETSKRPALSEVLRHNFFNHDFILTYKFLSFLPLKSDIEKQEFFSNILDSLKCYDEDTVAKQFSGLLLSRVTMLDQTAQKQVIPYILRPKNGRQQNDENAGFFSISAFKEHVKPRLMQLFAVRDTQIRMLLLTHFTKYVHVFTHEELSQHVLPELLLGIRDIDDNLVASTMICLSELVPILGADTVIGGKRSKMFSDGRPKSKSGLIVKPHDFYSTQKTLQDFTRSDIVYEKTLNLNERPSPVGGESMEDDLICVESSTNVIEKSDDEWSDWENTTRQLAIVNPSNKLSDIDSGQINKSGILNGNIVDTSNSCKEKPSNKSTLLLKAAIEAKKNIVDITELDIKNQKYGAHKKVRDEIDFFADMAPVIEKTTVVNIIENDAQTSKLSFVPDENETWGDGWDE